MEVKNYIRQYIIAHGFSSEEAEEIEKDLFAVIGLQLVSKLKSVDDQSLYHQIEHALNGQTNIEPAISELARDPKFSSYVDSTIKEVLTDWSEAIVATLSGDQKQHAISVLSELSNSIE